MQVSMLTMNNNVIVSSFSTIFYIYRKSKFDIQYFLFFFVTKNMTICNVCQIIDNDLKHQFNNIKSTCTEYKSISIPLIIIISN